jgi:hypothetical protein
MTARIIKIFKPACTRQLRFEQRCSERQRQREAAQAAAVAVFCKLVESRRAISLTGQRHV